MIYSIAAFGLLLARDQIGINTVLGRSDNNPPTYIWLTLNEAVLAAEEVNERTRKDRRTAHLGDASKFIVIGVEADWNKDTDLAAHNCPFATANELLHDRPFVLLQTQLPFAENSGK